MNESLRKSAFVTRLNRIVDSNPSLQRVRDCATSLYLNDLQVENLVNEVVRFQKTLFRYYHPREGSLGKEGELGFTHIRSVDVVNKQVSVVANAFSVNLLINSGKSCVYPCTVDLLENEYLFIYCGVGLIGHMPKDLPLPNVFTPLTSSLCDVMGFVDIPQFNGRLLYSPMSSESPVVTNGDLLFIARDVVNSDPAIGVPFLSFNFSGIKVRFGVSTTLK